MDRVFEKHTFGKIAIQKIGAVDPNFILYEAGWLDTGGHPSTWDVMEVKGSVFREAKKGKRKGELCIMVPGTKRTAYVTKSEIRAYEKEHGEKT